MKIFIQGKVSDMFCWGVVGDAEFGPDYVPRELGVGSGDYVDFEIDVETGQIVDWDKEKVLSYIKEKQQEEDDS